METESSTLSLSKLLQKMASGLAIRRQFAFDRSPKSCFAVSTAVWLLTANCRVKRGELLGRTNVFWAISETLYPSGLISFRTKPSLCLPSPKRWVLATHKTLSSLAKPVPTPNVAPALSTDASYDHSNYHGT
ncbi:MAG TPA: hypothetical protein DDZ51_09420 [Planctomycetaceae bacterium]|nr:hypothetical protein [Planctomycetaceae bacterium]